MPMTPLKSKHHASRALWLLLTSIGLLSSVGVTAPAQTQRLRVGPNVQVSTALGKDLHLEMQMAADPNNPDRLVACSMVMPSNYHGTETVTYVSHDRGKTWKPTLRVRGDDQESSSDPACDYGPDG